MQLDADWLRALILKHGADDVGFVSLESDDIKDQKEEILKSFPSGKTIISLVVKMNIHSIRAPQRSVANHEFHHAGKSMDEICRAVARDLNSQGIGALNEPMAFPMEYADFPGKSWIISHKPIAVAAGLGKMGIHRNVIHPKFGNFILLGSIVIDRELANSKSAPLDFNPCLECKLCVSACPVGAIHSDGYFNFSACMTHNYREFMGGFIDWVKAITESNSIDVYRSKFDDGETVSLWQSLSYGANYKAAYCMAVCPAGEDVITPYLTSRRKFVEKVLKPLQEKKELVYVVPGTDAEEHVIKRFPNKSLKLVGNGLSVRNLDGFISGAPLVFQPGKAKDIDCVIRFCFKTSEKIERIVFFKIKDRRLLITDKFEGKLSFSISAHERHWIAFLNGRLNLFWALVTRKIKTRGNLKHFKNFGLMFPKNN